MKNNYLVVSYLATRKKYQKYFSRLQRKIQSGTFSKLSASRKNFLLRKVEALRTKIASMEPKLAGITMAAGLMFLGATAQAQLVRDPLKNPFGQNPVIQDTLTWTVPSYGDIDNDGDFDLVLTRGGTKFYYYKNIGTSSIPEFTQQTGTNNPFDTLTTNFEYSSLEFADFDNDGDLDLVNSGTIWNTNAQIEYFKNIGTASAPVFKSQTGTNNPFPVISTYTSYMNGSAVDIDFDGDLDIFFSEGYSGQVIYFKNTGTSSNPSFALQSSTPFPTGDLTYGTDYFFMDMVDIDGDGDFDAVAGDHDSELLYFKNTGTKTAAVFTQITGSVFSQFSDRWLVPEFVDINNDGKKDMLLGTHYTTEIIMNSGTTTAPVFKLTFTSPSNNGNMEFADMDGDSDVDAVFVGYNYTDVYVYKNTGTATSAMFVSDSSSPVLDLKNFNAGQVTPAFVDLDADGDLDIVAGSYSGTFFYVENSGTASAPVYNPVSGTQNPFDGFDVGTFSAPSFVDLDNDGDMDMISGQYNYNGGLVYFKNTGSASAPVFTQVTGTDSPLPTTSVYRTVTAFADVDKDGDQDLVVGGWQYLEYFKNTGTASAPVFTDITGTDNPFTSSPVNVYYTPSFVDFDGDGDQDLLISKSDRTIDFYDNVKINNVAAIISPKSSAFSGSLIAYPNPVKDEINVSLNDAIGSNLTITVTDLAGNVLVTETFNNNGSAMNLNVENLTSGMYLLKISNESKAAVVKFVKQ